jgi:hypothetical protein
MNERIKELAKNYLVYEHFSRYGECVEEEQYEFYPDELEQFVKLIVRECIQSIKNTIQTVCDTDSEKMGCEFAITDLLEHFGVE